MRPARLRPGACVTAEASRVPPNGSPFVKNAASRLYWRHVGFWLQAAWDLIFARARVAAPRSGFRFRVVFRLLCDNQGPARPVALRAPPCRAAAQAALLRRMALLKELGGDAVC